MDANGPMNINPSDEDNDVEAHGLKEIAAGIGAAAVLGGAGAGAALAASSALVPPPPATPAHHVSQQAHNEADKTRALFKHRTPAPPVAVTTNNTRKPTPWPKVNVPHGRQIDAAANAPQGQGLKPAGTAVKYAAAKTAAKAKGVKTVPPITGPIL
jgi:hypothetical protein